MLHVPSHCGKWGFAMKRLTAVIAVVATIGALVADVKPVGGITPVSASAGLPVHPKGLPPPRRSVAAVNEVWLVTDLVDDGFRTTISYRIAEILPDGRVVATGRTGVFCVGSARAVADNSTRISMLEEVDSFPHRPVRRPASHRSEPLR